MEKLVVRAFIYPAILDPPASLFFGDQFAFRPTGSTTAALICMFDKLTNLLMTNSYVLLYSLDFSKAFDTVRHSTLFEKLATLKIPDQVYNWIADFYMGRSHCTFHDDIMSELLEIFASVIQGSGLGPSAYAVNAADLRPIDILNFLIFASVIQGSGLGPSAYAVNPADLRPMDILNFLIFASVIQGSGLGPSAYAVNAADLRPIDILNFLIKFADDTGLIVGARQLETRTRELNNIKEWALKNNLCLNESKSVEMVFVNKKRRLAFETPPSLNEIRRKHTTKLLGVIISDDSSMSAHITSVISSCEQAMYDLRMLKHYGLNQSSIYAVFQSVI